MTTSLFGDVAATVVGLVILTVGADFLVRGASALATRFGVPPLVIGLTVVAFGTSAPELAVSVAAALGGRHDVALGNVVGSNIFNILLILGLSALITPLIVRNQLVRLDVPVMVGVALLPLLMGLDGQLSPFEGVILLALLAGYLVLLFRYSAPGDAPGDAPRDVHVSASVATAVAPAPTSALATSLPRQLLAIGGGLAMLVFGADALVEGATSLARAAGVSELVVGLTVVAAGTSLPELATSVVASLRGERDLAVGNVVGSSIFNVLSVLGVGAAVSGGLEVAPGLLHFDLPVMLAVSLICLPVFMTGPAITRIEGGILVLYYIAYTAYLGLHATDHHLREEFGTVVLGVVVPFTLAVATAFWWRGRDRTGDAPTE